MRRNEISFDSHAPGVEEEWQVCPGCGGDGIEGGSVDIDDHLAIQLVGCGECGTEWRDVYRGVRKDRILYGHNVALVIAMHELDDEGISGAIEHTGGGVHVLYCRELGDAVPKGAHIGISDQGDERASPTSYLVCAYTHADDDGSAWQRDGVNPGDLAATVGEAKGWLVDANMMTESEAKQWARDLGYHYEPATERGWTRTRLGYADARFEIDEGSNRHMRAQPIRLQAWNFEVLYGVYWADEIGVNDWCEWFDTSTEAIVFLARLTAAVGLGEWIGSVKLEVTGESPF